MASHSIVVPGQPIASGQGNLQGRGTYLREDAAEEGPQLVASVAGTIERVNKLLTVKPAQSRYLGEVGDLIVGRVTEVGSKRWKVDINGQKDAILMLSSVNLPGGVQRIRTYEDQLQMRTFFQETDLISVCVAGDVCCECRRGFAMFYHAALCWCLVCRLRCKTWARTARSRCTHAA